MVRFDTKPMAVMLKTMTEKPIVSAVVSVSNTMMPMATFGVPVIPTVD